MFDSTTAKVLFLSLPLGLVACGRDKPAESATSYEDGPEAGLTPASGSVDEKRAAAASELGSSSVESLNDAQITAAAGAINQGEVDQARIAVDKAKNQSVQRFAETMIEHHGQAVKDVDAVETRAGLEPQESRLLATLRIESKDTEDKLDDTDATSFDKLYMMTQVDAHRKALDTLDSRLIPNTRNSELKDLLQSMRARVQSHLEMARAILNTL